MPKSQYTLAQEAIIIHQLIRIQRFSLFFVLNFIFPAYKYTRGERDA